MDITNRDPREASLIQMKRHLSDDLERVGQHVRHGLESSKFARGLLKVMGVLAVTMVISDGHLRRTPHTGSIRTRSRSRVRSGGS